MVLALTNLNQQMVVHFATHCFTSNFIADDGHFWHLFSLKCLFVNIQVSFWFEKHARYV